MRRRTRMSRNMRRWMRRRMRMARRLRTMRGMIRICPPRLAASPGHMLVAVGPHADREGEEE
eukprot:8227239-Pyramimonas_sp.AAC.1